MTGFAVRRRRWSRLWFVDVMYGQKRQFWRKWHGRNRGDLKHDISVQMSSCNDPSCTLIIENSHNFRRGGRGCRNTESSQISHRFVNRYRPLITIRKKRSAWRDTLPVWRGYFLNRRLMKMKGQRWYGLKFDGFREDLDDDKKLPVDPRELKAFWSTCAKPHRYDLGVYLV